MNILEHEQDELDEQLDELQLDEQLELQDDELLQQRNIDEPVKSIAGILVVVDVSIEVIALYVSSIRSESDTPLVLAKVGKPLVGICATLIKKYPILLPLEYI